VVLLLHRSVCAVYVHALVVRAIVCLPACLPACLSVCLSVYLLVYLSVCLIWCSTPFRQLQTADFRAALTVIAYTHAMFTLPEI